MRSSDRWIWAVGIVLVDIMVVVVPLTALAAAYILVVRPPWFKTWVEQLYQAD